MSSSTTQQNNVSPIEEEIQRRINKAQKKLSQVDQLIQKSKANKDFKLDNAAKQKIAQRPQFEEELRDTQALLDLYRQSQEKQARAAQKELKNAQRQAVNTVTNMIIASAFA